MNTKLMVLTLVSLVSTACATVEPVQFSREEIARREANFRAAVAGGYRPQVDGGAAEGQAQMIQGMQYMHQSWSRSGRMYNVTAPVPTQNCRQVTVVNPQTGMYDLVQKCD